MGQDRTPDLTMDEFLDFTLNRLRNRYSEEDSENMFFEDDIYANFLTDMRALLQDEKAFKDRYCKINNVVDRSKKVIESKGCEAYTINNDNNAFQQPIQ